ncbi:hypothetical protein J6590_019285 [Homalodisca vitripennis]|nr:hypothetical protein J6590_019285 [Homalodisca vitripennis]
MRPKGSSLLKVKLILPDKIKNSSQQPGTNGFQVTTEPLPMLSQTAICRKGSLRGHANPDVA